MVTEDPTVDVAQQLLPMFNGDAALQDPGVALFVEFALHKDEGLGTACELSGLHLVHQQRIMEEVVKVERPLVI